jgi:hypothetical protein
MHAFTSHRDGARRYFVNLDLPTHPLCWLRGHRAKAEVIDSKYGDSWVLIACRTCGVHHSDPYLSHGKISEAGAREDLDRQIAAARDNNAAYAAVRDGRDGYGHHRIELALEIVGSAHRKPGLHLHIGDRWSETPLDGSITGRKRAAYFSVGGVGNRLAHWLTKGEKRDVRIGAGYKAIP